METSRGGGKTDNFEGLMLSNLPNLLAILENHPARQHAVGFIKKLSIMRSMCRPPLLFRGIGESFSLSQKTNDSKKESFIGAGLPTCDVSLLKHLLTNVIHIGQIGLPTLIPPLSDRIELVSFSIEINTWSQRSLSLPNLSGFSGTP